MHTDVYARSLRHAYQVNWTIEEVLGDRSFDPSKRWLPLSLSAAPTVAFLDEREKRALSQIEMAAYSHLFAYVEAYIAPMVAELARGLAIDHREGFDALTNFAAEEVKHMNLFRAIGDRVDRQLGFQLARLEDETGTARFVLGKSRGAALLLTASIEWMTQRHYLDAFQDDAELDALTKSIFKAHWQEESQHAQLDDQETLRVFASMPEAERERAITDLIELVAAVDGLLRKQTEHDLANFAAYLGRTFTPAETDELRAALMRAKHWTFITSGVTHPNFQKLFASVTTPAQQARVGAALEHVLGDGLAAAA